MKKSLLSDAGSALWHQRAAVKTRKTKLTNFAKVINHQLDFSLAEYAQLFALTLEFQPTLIIELGRGWGNSTAVLTEAANKLPMVRKVISVCLSDNWQKSTVKKISPFVEKDWFAKLDMQKGNILESSFHKLIKPSDRVLLFWDAHGWDVAHFVLGDVFPRLSNNDNLVIIHDIKNLSYNQKIKNYSKYGIWKEYPGDNIHDYPYYIINGKASFFEELLVVNDFTERNDLTLRSVEEEINRKIYKQPYRQNEIRKLLGKDFSAHTSSLYWLTLPSNQKTWHFPPSHKQSVRNKKTSYAVRSQPLVSIITPCKNNGRYLESCIQSVLRQTYPHVEHIIQDSASTDDTAKILKKYSRPQYNRRVKWVSEKDAGQSDGLDRALKRMTGDIFLVLNADDELMPWACEWGVQQLIKNHPDAGAVYGDEYIIDENGTITNHFIGKYPYDYMRLFCVELVPPAQAAFVRTNSFKKVGLHADTSLATCPDFEMWVRLGMKYPLYHEFGTVSKYRHHAGSEGKQSDMVPKMIAAKSTVIDRTFANPKTAKKITVTRRRAYAGLYHWAANVARGNGAYKQELRYLLLSTYFKPELHKFIRLTRFIGIHGVGTIKNLLAKI